MHSQRPWGGRGARVFRSPHSLPTMPMALHGRARAPTLPRERFSKDEMYFKMPHATVYEISRLVLRTATPLRHRPLWLEKLRAVTAISLCVFSR